MRENVNTYNTLSYVSSVVENCLHREVSAAEARE